MAIHKFNKYFDMENSINEEAIWEKLSEIGKKVDAVLSNTARQEQPAQFIQPSITMEDMKDMEEAMKKHIAVLANFVNKQIREMKPPATKEEVEAIAGKHARDHTELMKKLYQQGADQLDKIMTGMASLKGKIDQLPTPEPVSLEPIIQMFPKPKKVNICGFEFLRTSVIMSVLIALSFISLTVKIKLRHDNDDLIYRYGKQSEYILQMQERQAAESEEQAKKKEQVKTKEKKK